MSIATFGVTDSDGVLVFISRCCMALIDDIVMCLDHITYVIWIVYVAMCEFAYSCYYLVRCAVLYIV